MKNLNGGKVERVAANIQIMNKENKYGRVSEFTLWGKILKIIVIL